LVFPMLSGERLKCLPFRHPLRSGMAFEPLHRGRLGAKADGVAPLTNRVRLYEKKYYSLPKFLFKW
jgi:hypothetical protein